jgi:hypothetical protein
LLAIGDGLQEPLVVDAFRAGGTERLEPAGKRGYFANFAFFAVKLLLTLDERKKRGCIIDFIIFFSQSISGARVTLL